MRALIGLTVLTLTSAAQGAPLPDGVAAMIDAAAANPDQLKAVVEIAKKTNPTSVSEIDARVAALNKQAADAKQAKLSAQGFLDGWKGQGEAGAFTSSGNTQSTGVAIGLVMTKETLEWRHKIAATVDYQRDSHVTTKERYTAGYEGNYNITPRFFALAVAGYERDKFAGYSSRFTEGLGFGYKLVDTPVFKVDLEGGPALRQTDYILGYHENNLAGRAAANLLWQISPDTTLTENATGYFASSDTTLSSTTALTAKLVGALSARASFVVINESNPPAGRKKTDTTTRATLVYAF